MKQFTHISIIILSICLFFVFCEKQHDPMSTENPENIETGSLLKPDGCVWIKDGTLTYSTGHYLEGEPLTLGYDPFGYNYQAHMFKESYSNAYLGRDGYPPYEGDDEAYLAENPTAESHWTWQYRDVEVMMQWNDAWLSNKDCDNDGSLDRYYGFSSYIGSGAWLTNHMRGTDEVEGNWTYFVKIVAVPADATLDDDIWYAADETEIGPEIWGAFAIIQEVESSVGATYVSPAGPGFGKW